MMKKKMMTTVYEAADRIKNHVAYYGWITQSTMLQSVDDLAESVNISSKNA
jgi:hypothetical protein